MEAFSAVGRVSETLLVFATSDAYRWLPLGLLAIAAMVAGREWRRLSAGACQDIALAASLLFGALALAVPFTWLADARAVPRELWSAPFERLAVVASLAALGWAFLPRPISGAVQAVVFGSLGMAAGAFLFSAAAGQRAGPQTGITGPWLAIAANLTASGLAATIGYPLYRVRAAPRGWLIPLLACQAVAGCLEVALPLDATVAVWWRLAVLASALVLSAAAFGECATLREPASFAGSAARPPGSTFEVPVAARRQAPLSSAAAMEGQFSPALAADLGPPASAPPTSESKLGGSSAPSAAVDPWTVAPSAAAAPAVTSAPRTQHRRGAPDPTAERVAAPTAVDDPLERIARYEAAMLDLPVGILVADAQGRTLFGNALAEHLLARSLPAGRPVSEFFPDPPLVESALRDLLGAAMASSRATASSTAKARAAATDGSTAQASSTLAFERDAARLHLDIRPLVRRDGEMVGALLLLSQRLAEERPSLSPVVSRLVEAMRTPLANLAGYSQLLGRAAGSGSERDGRLLERLDANLDRLRLGLNNLLAILAGPADGASAATPVDLSRALAEAAERAESEYREKGLVLNVAASDDLPNVAVPREIVAALLDNLLANAAQRSPHGAEVSAQLIAPEEAPGKPSVILVVRDAGPSLPASERGAVNLDHGPGDTTGLLVARLLAEGHGCRAWIESDPPHTRYCVRFPVLPGKA